MCGICGKFNFDRENPVSHGLIKSMADTISHRGPDDEGYYLSGSLALGFRRLSIIDLSSGHQPLANEDESVWIVFNGEIYNYQELRGDLQRKGHVFKTRTDTEVIVHLYEEYGALCVEKLRGMFGFAIWDTRRQSLLLARDRVGIKPLYYHLTKKSLIFASEIKAILADPEVEPQVNSAMIDRFLTFYYVPGGETLLKDIHKLEPGTYLEVRNGSARITQYWDLKFEVHQRPETQAEHELIELMEESVQMHMIADVPVGFLLSGGVDSTAMLGMAAGKTDKSPSSYTLGFSNPGIIDERPYARLAASFYGSEHHEMTITSREFADFVPHFAWYMEEPCCEPQAVALYYITKLARNYVKVLISGEGGDEAFAGYPIYRNFLWLERIKKLTGPLNGAISSLLCSINQKRPSQRLTKYASIFRMPLDSYYYGRTSNPGLFFNSRTEQLYTPDFLHEINRDFSTSIVKKCFATSAGAGNINRMLYMDMKTSLPDDILLKADKMTMANSIELRVPLLDHKVIEFAASLPENFKVRGFKTKYIAKRALRHRVPKEILDRKKAGFPVPYDSWMRTELKDWVHEILLGRQATERGYFNRKCIEQLVQEDQRFQNHAKEILSLVSLELWHRAFIDKQSPAYSELTLAPARASR